MACNRQVKRPTKRTYPQSVRDEFWRIYEETMSAAVAARRVGVPKGTADNWVHRWTRASLKEAS